MYTTFISLLMVGRISILFSYAESLAMLGNGNITFIAVGIVKERNIIRKDDGSETCNIEFMIERFLLGDRITTELTTLNCPRAFWNKHYKDGIEWNEIDIYPIGERHIIGENPGSNHVGIFGDRHEKSELGLTIEDQIRHIESVLKYFRAGDNSKLRSRVLGDLLRSKDSVLSLSGIAISERFKDRYEPEAVIEDLFDSITRNASVLGTNRYDTVKWMLKGKKQPLSEGTKARIIEKLRTLGERPEITNGTPSPLQTQ